MSNTNDKVPWDPDYDPFAEIDVLSKRCDEYERDLRKLRDANRSLGEALKAALQQVRGQDEIDDDDEF